MSYWKNKITKLRNTGKRVSYADNKKHIRRMAVYGRIRVSKQKAENRWLRKRKPHPSVGIK